MDDSRVFEAYGRAMQAAQHLEGMLKLLLGLQKVTIGLTKAPAPLSSEEFEDLLRGKGKTTFGQAVRLFFDIVAKIPEAEEPPDEVLAVSNG